MKQKLVVVGYFTLTLASLASCEGHAGIPSAPTGSDNSNPAVVAVTITGESRVTTLGQVTPLAAVAVLSDGSTRDVTSTARWSSSDPSTATVSADGFVTFVGFGRVTIAATYPQRSPSNGVFPKATFTITALPDGTYILAGRVTDAVSFPLNGVRVELSGGPNTGRTTLTDATGYYTFAGVAGVLQVIASKDGYVPATQNISADTGHVDLVLSSSIPPATIAGIYRLTLTASPSCQLPDDLRHRTYTAVITQTGIRATVTLSDAQFWTDAYCGRMNSFDAYVHGNTVFFSNYGGDCGVFEQVANMGYLNWAVFAEAAVSDTMSVVFNGQITLVPSEGNRVEPIAACEAPDHQLVFERTGT